MIKTNFDIQENVINNYEVTYDEVKLKELGYTSLKEYCEATNSSPWDLEDVDDNIITSIEYIELVEYVDEWKPLGLDNIEWEEDNE